MKKLLTLLTALFFLGSMTVVHADTWTVAGSNTTILGASWSTSETANDMTNTDGNNWYLLKVNKSVSATLEYKVAKNHAWGTAYPGSNASITLSGSSYDVLFKFVNDNNHSVSAAKVTSWTVAGTQAVMGSDWSQNDNNNKMSRSGSNYTLTKSNVALLKNTNYECKVLANQEWTYAFPSANKEFTVSNDGIYNVTFTFNTSTFAVSVTTTYVSPLPVSIHSNIKNPSWETSVNFTLAGNNETASLTLTDVTKGDYELGVKIADEWTSNGSAFTRANSSHAITSGSGNCTFKADVAGDYTFTWTYETNTLAITYPAPPTYSVDFVGLENIYFVNDAVTFNATSTGVDNPTYTYYVKKGDAAYGSAVTSYTFAETGTYTVKVEVRENGAGEVLKTEEQTVTVDNPLTLYFVNKDAWSNVKIYLYNPSKSDWPGDAMTATGDATAFHNYPVYSYTVHSSVYGSANVVFNNGSGSQTEDLSVNAKHYFYNNEWYATLAECDPLPTIKMHGDFLGSWNTTDPFVVAGNKQTASLSLTIPAKGMKGFGMRIGSDDNWTSNGAAITRASASAEIVSGSENCSLNADIPGEYIFTWTYASNTLSVTYPELPDQMVEFDGLSAEILKGTEVNFAATSSGITNPVYTYYVKPAGGEYGSSVSSYTFDAEGSYTVKVSAEGDNTAAPVVEEANVVVYATHTFTAGTRIYVDFSAMTDGAKGVNYPIANEADIAYDANGAGTFKTVCFSTNVTWSTLADVFVKTEKAGWAALKFSVPADGQNKIIVAADGASYTWGTYTPSTVQVKFFAPRDESSNWDHVYVHSWDAAGDITSWPGVEITDSKENLWYAYDVQVGANLVFHNNAGMQTNNIENVQAAACYEPTAINYDVTPKVVTVAVNAGCEIAYHIAGSKALIGGAADFDTSLPLDENNQIVFHDVKPGTYDFKINNGTWAWALGGNDHLKSGDCQAISQTVGLGNVGFKIDTKQDVTITYYPETEEICLGAVTVKADGEVTANDMAIEAGESKAITYSTNNTEATGAAYDIVSGGEYILLKDGVITGIKHGESVIRVTIAETANYTEASEEFTVIVSTPADPGIAAIAPVGGKFLINANHDTIVFARGNLQYQQSSNTWRCAPNQYDWKGMGNLQMGNAVYEGWVDLFCWSIGAENNYGATSAYNNALYYNKPFVDWGTLFTDTYEWSTLSINEWYYLLYSRPNADEKWGMAMIGDNLGMILLPEEWTAPSGVTFVAGTMPTTDMWDDDDCLDPGIEDHWRIHPENMPANKFTVAEWEILEAAGAVFFPYGGRRSGGYGNHTNRNNETVSYEYAYYYYENYQGAYWTSTLRNTAEGKMYWLPMMCNGCTGDNENWGRGSHGWWGEGRYGHSVRLVTRIPREEEVIRDGLSDGKWGTICPKQNVEYVNGAVFYQISSLEEKNGLPFNMLFDEISGSTLTAGQPYFFIASAEAIKGSKVGDELDAAGDGVNGFYGYIGAASWELPYVADYDPASDNTFVIYDNSVFRINQSGTMLRSERCYIKINATEPTRASVAPAPGRRRISLSVQNTNVATGVENVQGDKVQCTKVIENGVLYLIYDGTKYNVQGQMVK